MQEKKLRKGWIWISGNSKPHNFSMSDLNIETLQGRPNDFHQNRNEAPEINSELKNYEH